MMPAPRACVSCGALVIDLCSEKTGWGAPINVMPVPGGNVEVNHHAGTYAVVKPSTDIRYVSHFATCRFASSHRKAAT